MGLGASTESSQSPPCHTPTDPLSPLETRQLMAAFTRAQGASSRDVFHSQFIAKIVENSGAVQQFNAFRDFAVRTTKGSTKKAMEYVWEMLQLHREGDGQQRTLLYYFILFVVELAIINGCLTVEDESCNNLLVEKYKQFILNYLNVEEDEIELGNSFHSILPFIIPFTSLLL